MRLLQQEHNLEATPPTKEPSHPFSLKASFWNALSKIRKGVKTPLTLEEFIKPTLLIFLAHEGRESEGT